MLIIYRNSLNKNLAIPHQSSFQEHLSFLELLCVYGYSLGIYVPVAILWVVQISWFQWILVLLGATLSGFVLLTTVAPAVEGKKYSFVINKAFFKNKSRFSLLTGPKKIVVLFVVIGLHFLLAVGFMLYFFHVPVKFQDASVIPIVLKNNSSVTSKY